MRSAPVLLLLALACAPVGRGVDPAADGAPAALAPVDTACPADFDTTESVVRADYAGFSAKVAGREAELVALTDSIRAELGSVRDARACSRSIARWLGFFRDAHLVLTGRSAQQSAAAESSAVDVQQGGDRRRPSLRFYEDSTAVLRLPDFSLPYASVIDSLIAANREQLLATPHLVIDVRTNGGGWSGSYASILPLLYTNPIRVDGIDTWSTPGNIEAMRSGLREGVPEEVQAMIRGVLPLMEANPQRFVPLEADREIRLDTVYPLPRAVAVLVGSGCASSCEQFVLEARQSRKVTVLGQTNTRGALDYLNVRTVDLPSRRWQLRVPIARSHRLPAVAYDGVGIAPEVRIPREENPVDFARLYLRSLTAANP